MSLPTDPTWMRGAERIFAACLFLYPKSLRDSHGEEMRQVFRDRCHEVTRGESRAFRLFALELLPDTLRSAGHEQISATFGTMRPRQYWALGLLCCAALGLLFRDSLSRHTLDLAFDVRYGLRNIQDAREMARREDAVRSLAEQLQARDGLESKALAAYLYRSIYTGRDIMYVYGDDRGGSPFIGKLPADGERAAEIAAGVMGEHPDIYPLVAAVQACEVAVGCNRAVAIQRLIERDPENANGWSLQFKWAAQHDDKSAMRAALQGMAQARYYENYQGRITRDLVAAAQELSPGEPELLAIVAKQARSASYLGTYDFKHDVRYSCTARPSGHYTYDSRWLEVNPDSWAECLRIAELLSSSTDVISARWGWRQIYRNASDDEQRAQAFRRLRDSQWLYQNFFSFGSIRKVDGSWRDWNADEWLQWSASFEPGDGEKPAMKRWLVSRGLPATAPADFELPRP